MTSIKYLTAYTIPMATALALYLKGPFSFAALIYAFGIIPLLEIILKEDSRNDQKEVVALKKANKVYLFLKDNKFTKKGKDFRKFGKYSNCKKKFKISSELERAVLNSDFKKIEILVKETIKNIL